MTDKELIKQEIERRIDLYSIAEKNDSTFARMRELSSLIDFIDSLPKEHVNDDLEEEIERFLDEDENIPSYSKTARHFAEWQRKKDQETIELAEDHAMLAGMIKEREEMMKDTVDATVYEGVFNKYVKERDEGALTKVLANFENRDRVKIIIVKED